MADARGKAWTFDTVAGAYDKFRPGYPDELFRAIFAYRPIDAASRVVEVGIGAGQATPPFLKTGCALTAVEYGEQLAQLCREKFAAYPAFSAIAGKFEDTRFPDDAFDLVYSATAFHWVPEELGYPQVFRMLKSGGAFARFRNHPYPGRDDPALSEAVQRAYAEYYYPYYGKAPRTPREYTVAEAEELAKVAEKYGFIDIRCAVFSRTRTFTAGEYRGLIGTYSDHITIGEPVREKFFSAVEEAIERHGGSITIHDTIDLQLARKP